MEKVPTEVFPPGEFIKDDDASFDAKIHIHPIMWEVMRDTKLSQIEDLKEQVKNMELEDVIST